MGAFMRVVMMMILMGISYSASVHGQEMVKEKDFLREIQRQLVNREERFVIPCDRQIAAFYEDSPGDLLTEVLSIKQNTSDVGDFLRYSISRAAVDFEHKQDSSPSFSFQVQYYDRADDLRKVEVKINDLLKELRVGADTPEARVRKIHDYVVMRSKLYPGEGRSGAADALISRSASSRGYALLTYKMLYEAKVPVRIVEGTLDNRPHWWNLVQLDGAWYHLDTAADDRNTSDVLPVQYQFFLVGSDAVGKTHQLGELYDSVDFHENLAISPIDYGKRGQLILAGQAVRVRAKSGGGVFDDAYNSLSNTVLDPVYRMNDHIANKVLDSLEFIFGL